jgi:hypothetical protein
VAAFAGLLALGGCLDPQPQEAHAAIEVTSSAVRIAGPSGFCVDPSDSTGGSDSAFVVLGSCAAIANRPTLPQPDVPVVLTAAVSRGRTVAPTALEAYFKARKQAQAGNAPAWADEQILDVALRGDVVFLHFSDRTHGNDWRGILGIDPDVTVTLAVRSPANVRVSQTAQLAALRAFADQIVRANADRVLVASGT